MRRFFVSQECIQGRIAVIAGEEAHHILDVIRLKQGDRLQAIDGTGKLYQGTILETARRKVKIRLESVLEKAKSSGLEIVLIQALLKKNKMDYIVEKCTEAGVSLIVPTKTTRSIVRLDQAQLTSRKKRWRRIAQETAKQCRRTTIPQIRDLVAWPDVLSSLGNFDLKLLFSLSAESLRLKKVLRKHNRAKKVAILIGPEGDFAPGEITQAQDSGWIAVSLGKNVLKSDTAAISALAMVNYELQE